MRLRGKALLALVALASVLASILFACAGSVSYWQGWVYLGVFFLSSLAITLYIAKNDPALLERRMLGGPTAEKEISQKIIQSMTSIAFLALLVVPAIDARLMWSHVPVAAVIAGDALTALSFYFIFLVYKENSFASATIEIAENQQVVSTGPYAIVRHPMYASALLLFIGTPLALGSYWGLLGLSAVLPGLIWRLLDEERFLEKNLNGYADYCAKVRWRLIPGLF